MPLIIFFLVVMNVLGCDSKKNAQVRDADSFECRQQQIKNQYIVHWRYRKAESVEISDVEELKQKNLYLIDFIEPNYSIRPENGLQLSQLNEVEIVKAFHDELDIQKQWSQGFLGQNQVVALIDTGVDRSHPNLKDNIFQNLREIEGNNIDDDQNGFVDDSFGWNFLNQGPNVEDEVGHGTAMAGIISGRHQGQLQESLGLAPRSLILPLDILSGSTGSEFDAKNAIDYAVLMGVNIINNSWSIQCSDYLRSASLRYQDSNVIFVNSAGNYPQDVFKNSVMLSSQILKNFLNVGSLQPSEQASVFSGFGPSINVWSPGENIPILSDFETMEFASGTSLSAAYISGVTAVVWSRYPSESAQQITARILKTSKKRGSLQIFQF